MNIAFITQTYKPDFNECKMLCRSMDIFANTYDHFIFVNDEDINHFNELNYGRHHVLKKSTILEQFQKEILKKEQEVTEMKNKANILTDYFLNFIFCKTVNFSNIF